MTTIFDVLDQVKARPVMYLGEIDGEVARLLSLELLISGYTLAVQAHRLEEPVADLLRGFANHLWRTRGWSAACGPVAAIRDAAGNDTGLWDAFWLLLAEYRQSLKG